MEFHQCCFVFSAFRNDFQFVGIFGFCSGGCSVVLGAALGSVAAAGFVCGEFCFLRVVGLAVYWAAVGGGCDGLVFWDWDCKGKSAWWELACGFAVGVCGAVGGAGLFQICEFFCGEFEDGLGLCGMRTWVDDAEYPLAGMGKFLHFQNWFNGVQTAKD